MSAIKRAVAQKTALQQCEVIAVAPIAVEAIPAVEKVLAAVQAAEDKVEQAQDTVAAAQEDLPVDLAQMAEEFHAESVAFASESANGEILLAQAGQEKKDDGGAALTDDDGGLGAGGIAGLVGLGLIAAAGGGGGGSGYELGFVDSQTARGSKEFTGGNMSVRLEPNNYTWDGNLNSKGEFIVTASNAPDSIEGNDPNKPDIQISWKDFVDGKNVVYKFWILDVDKTMQLTIDEDTDYVFTVTYYAAVEPTPAYLTIAIA